MTGVSVKKKSRMANLELLRIVSMMFIVVLHYLGKGELLPSLADKGLPFYAYYPWILEALAIVAVNAYMLLTGYFMADSSFKVSRLIKTILQVWFYAVVVGVTAGAFGLFPEEGLCVHYMLSLLFPVIMNHYWFMTAYVFMYVFTPLIAVGAGLLGKKQLQIVVIGLLVIFAGVKSVVPAALDGDAMGYDSMWYLCVCVLAVYLRRYGIPWVKTVKRGLLVWIGGAVAIVVVTMGLRLIYLQTDQLGPILTICFHYNHILTLLAAVGFFGIFCRMREPGGRAGKWILCISPYTLGVYLLHEHLALRYQWQSWLGAEAARGSLGVFLWAPLAVCVVFVAGILAERLRVLLFAGIHRALRHVPPYERLVACVEKLDLQMAEKTGRTEG